MRWLCFAVLASNTVEGVDGLAWVDVILCAQEGANPSIRSLGRRAQAVIPSSPRLINKKKLLHGQIVIQASVQLFSFRCFGDWNLGNGTFLLRQVPLLCSHVVLVHFWDFSHTPFLELPYTEHALTCGCVLATPSDTSSF